MQTSPREALPDAPKVPIASFPRSVAGLEGSTTIRAVVCDPEEAALLPASAVERAKLGSMLEEALEANTQIVLLSVQLQQRLQVQYHLLREIKTALESD